MSSLPNGIWARVLGGAILLVIGAGGAALIQVNVLSADVRTHKSPEGGHVETKKRVEALERESAANQVRFETIRDQNQRIERGVEELLRRQGVDPATVQD